MKTFVIGTVLEPEVKSMRTKKDGSYRSYVAFGLLSGRSSTEFQVWDNDKAFDKVKGLGNGEVICALVGFGVDRNGRLKNYFNDCAPCSDELREGLRALFT